MCMFVRNYSCEYAVIYERDWFLCVYVLGWKSRPNTILIYNLQYAWICQPNTATCECVFAARANYVGEWYGVMNAPDSHPRKRTKNRDDPERFVSKKNSTATANASSAGEEKQEKKITNGLMRIINVCYGFILVISFNCQLIHFLAVISLIIKSKN